MSNDPNSGGGGMTGADMHRLGIGQAQAPDANAQPADLSDLINQLFDKTGAWVTKMSGVNVQSMFNVGITKHTDFQQASLPGAKDIGAGLPININGGFLANLFSQIFKPDGAALTDHSGGVGGSAQGEGGSFGDSMAMGGGGGASFDPSGLDIGALPTGDMRFASADMPSGIANLGNYEPPITPSTGQSSSAGMAV